LTGLATTNGLVTTSSLAGLDIKLNGRRISSAANQWGENVNSNFDEENITNLK
jgi:hypothetical protein